MAATFSLKDPQKRPCPECEGTGVKQLRIPVICPHCYGRCWVGDPSATFSDDNTRDLLRLLGIQPKRFGVFLTTWLPDIQRRIIFALNSRRRRARHLRGLIIDGEAVVCNSDDSRLLYRLKVLTNIIQEAIRQGTPVCWT